MGNSLAYGWVGDGDRKHLVSRALETLTFCGREMGPALWVFGSEDKWWDDPDICTVCLKTDMARMKRREQSESPNRRP